MHSIVVNMWTAVLVLLLLTWLSLAVAQNTSANYSVVLASGFLCDPDDASSCPVVAKAAPGDSYELTGAGAFDAQNKSAMVAGTYAHKATNGRVLETGVWTAHELVTFVSYGVAPQALQREKARVALYGPLKSGAKRLTIGDPVPTGGFAVFRIQLSPISGPTRAANLEVNCALGDVPRERSVEGIRLLLDGISNGYSEEAGGRVMFLATRPTVSAPAKAPQQDAPDTLGPQQNQR